jgi:hypothetical protein
MGVEGKGSGWHGLWQGGWASSWRVNELLVPSAFLNFLLHASVPVGTTPFPDGTFHPSVIAILFDVYLSDLVVTRSTP